MNRRVAIVTGAGRGIGAAIAAELLAADFEVWCWDIDGEGLAKTVQLLNQGSTGHAIAQVCDIRSRDSVRNAVGALTGSKRVVHTLVNNAFKWSPHGTLSEIADSDFSRDLDMLLLGPQRVTAEVRPFLKSGSSVITIASVHGITASPHWGTYDIAKSALIQWARVLGAELGPSGITSNIIAPGIIATSEYGDESLHRMHVAAGLMPRVGEPSDVGRLVAFLADPRNSFITGAVIPVDGGMTTRLSLTAMEQVLEFPALSKGDY